MAVQSKKIPDLTWNICITKTKLGCAEDSCLTRSSLLVYTGSVFIGEMEQLAQDSFFWILTGWLISTVNHFWLYIPFTAILKLNYTVILKVFLFIH